MHFRPAEDYVLLGYSNGILRLHKLQKNTELSDGLPTWSMDDFWLITLHDPLYGVVREIYPIDTISGHMVLTCAQDGSILIHKGKLNKIQSNTDTNTFEITLVDASLEECAEKAKEVEKASQLAREQEEQAIVEKHSGKKFKSKLKLTWDEAAAAAPITDQKVKKYEKK